jgi:hypothetical protein
MREGRPLSRKAVGVRVALKHVCKYIALGASGTRAEIVCENGSLPVNWPTGPVGRRDRTGAACRIEKTAAV